MMRTILLIKGDRALREFFAEALIGEGYRVLIARDGAEGLAFLENTHPDLIAVGGEMPGMTDWDVAAACASARSIAPRPEAEARA